MSVEEDLREEVERLSVLKNQLLGRAISAEVKVAEQDARIASLRKGSAEVATQLANENIYLWKVIGVVREVCERQKLVQYEFPRSVIAVLPQSRSAADVIAELREARDARNTSPSCKTDPGHYLHLPGSYPDCTEQGG